MSGLDNVFWIVSIPGSRAEGEKKLAYGKLEKIVMERGMAQSIHFLNVPMLKVGTLDNLMSMSDVLGRMDRMVGGVVKKIARTIGELLRNHSDQIADALVAPDNRPLDTFVTKFRWAESRFSSTKALQDLANQLERLVFQADEELKKKVGDYHGVRNTLAAIERRHQGSLLARSLQGLVRKKHWVDTEHLTTVFVVVPSIKKKEWEESYEFFHELVVPRSSSLIEDDGDNALYNVMLFRTIADEFKHTAKERGFTVRDFKFDKKAAENAGIEKQKLEQESAERYRRLLSWATVNFGDTFSAWCHLKVLRVFVESVLRYGLPVNFETALILPYEKTADKLKRLLDEDYAHLSGLGAHEDSKAMDSGLGEEFHPFVFLELGLDVLK